MELEKSQNKKVHFVSLGCPKNLVDTEMMLASLMKDGYEITDVEAEADTIIVNTCGFIEDSKKESVSKILEMSELKKDGKLNHLVVAGCLTQRYKDELVDNLPEGDVFVGSGEFHKIGDILKAREQGSEQKKYFNLPTYLQEDDTPRVNSQPRWRAYLKISEGCKKRCSFCAIPKIRGNLQSRRIPSIVNEAKLLVAGGVREVNVVSHDFTDFGWDLKRENSEAIESPVEVLKALSDVKGLDWIRVLYLYPDGITQELVELIRDRSNLVKYFDMPLQHINNDVLKAMNRKMTKEKIVEVLNMIRSIIPDAVIRTQFIVGFPGETEEQFEELLAFVKEQKFDRVGCFQYSPEENTPGGKMLNQVDEKTKARRFHKLMKAQMPISRKKHESYIGQIIDVVVEGQSDETELLLQGRMSQQAPEIDGVVLINDGNAEPGQVVRVRITESHDYDLVGEIVDENELH